MHRKLDLKNQELYSKIRQISNITKFKILELTQEKELDITELSKLSNLAFNKCSNYCTSLEKAGLVIKKREGVNTFIKSKISLKEISLIFHK
jgi:predicted transcriptional regulator